MKDTQEETIDFWVWDLSGPTDRHRKAAHWKCPDHHADHTDSELELMSRLDFNSAYNPPRHILTLLGASLKIIFITEYYLSNI
jgi:hypothetical protein